MKFNRLWVKSWLSIKLPIQPRVIFAFQKFSVSTSVLLMKTIAEITEALVRGETSARAEVQAAIDAAEKMNDELTAFLEMDRAGALKRAASIDPKKAGPLAGVPV